MVVKANVAPFLSKIVIRRMHRAAELFDVRRHRHARQGGDFGIVRTATILRNDVAQEIDSRGSDRVHSERASISGCANAQEKKLESPRD